MNSLQAISKYLAASPFDWRQNARKALYNSALSSGEAINQIRENLHSDSFDIVENSLRVLFNLSHSAPHKITGFKNDIFKTAKRCNHFKIAYFACRILENLMKVDGSAKKEFAKTSKLITPKNFVTRDNDNSYHYFSCDHMAEYILGDADYRYKLGNVCNAFEYECKKALKKVLQIMRGLGYKKGKQYWKEVPSRWKRNYAGEKSYKTKLQYYSYHSIQIFLMWCIKNLSITKESWDNLLREQNNYEPSDIDKQITDRPDFTALKGAGLDVGVWLKQKIKREDVYSSVKLNQPWVVLFENTRIRYEEKEFHREISTCFTRESLRNTKKKQEVFAPYYTCNHCTIDEIPSFIDTDTGLSICGHDAEGAEGKLTPSYGTISEAYTDSTFNPLFPTPELVKYLKLKQQKGRLEYYKGSELVVKCINWQNGYVTNAGYSGEDRFELADYGSALIIKSKYLKLFLKTHKLRLLSTGEIVKRKIDKYSRDYDYKKENTRRKRFAFEISKRF